MRMKKDKKNCNRNDVKIPKVGAIVLLKEDVKNKAHWRLGRVTGKVTGRDGAFCGLTIKLGNGYTVE